MITVNVLEFVGHHTATARSQAKRLFDSVLECFCKSLNTQDAKLRYSLDFSGIEWISPSFADELFRVQRLQDYVDLTIAGEGPVADKARFYLRTIGGKA